MGTLVCRIELDKKKGIVLTVENSGDKITQTIVMDGKKIETTVHGDKTSVITQDQDGITIDCKAFTLNAETINCSSSKTMDLESGEGLTIAGRDLDISAQNGADISAVKVNVVGDSSTQIKGLKLVLSGETAAELKGGSIKIKSSGMLDMLAGGFLKVKGAIVNIKNLKNIS